MRLTLRVVVAPCLVAVSCAGPGTAPGGGQTGLAGYRVLRDELVPRS